MEYYEIDFLPAGNASKSGDAICIRYKKNDEVFVSIVDGGYQGTGESVVDHIKKYYGVSYVDNVVATHPDGDHAGGLKSVLEEFNIGRLWMNCPWHHTEELLPRFETYTSVDRLRSRLRKLFPHLAALEDIAIEKEISIYSAFQGDSVGEFRVMAPKKSTFLDLVVECERTPEPVKESASIGDAIGAGIREAANLVRSLWGAETFPANDTESVNAMSVVQYANILDSKILLTGDVGRAGLNEAADYAPLIGLALPGLDGFQIPHHGGRHNVSTETLDRWLGEKLEAKPDNGYFNAYVSVAKESTTHPRKSVVRAVMHRGGRVIETKGAKIWSHSANAPARADYASSVTPLPYPEEQEE